MKAQMISLSGRRKKKLERQIEKYLSALKSHRKDYKLHIDLGDAYVQLEHVKKSVDAYYSAINLLRQAPNTGKTRNLIIELYEKITQVAPNEYKAYIELSEEYFEAGQKEKAFRFLLSSAKKAYEEENYELALHCYNQAIAKGRTNPYIVERCTELYIKLGRKEEAMQNYIKIGDLYAQEEKNIEALEYYKKACSLNQDDPELLLKVARMYNAMAWTENAASELVKVGEHYEKQKEYTEALRYYRYSVRLDPENEKAQEGRTRINDSYSMDDLSADELMEGEAEQPVDQDVLEELDRMEESVGESSEESTYAEFDVTPLDATLTFEGVGTEALSPEQNRQTEGEALLLEEESSSDDFGLAETMEPEMIPLDSDDALLVFDEEADASESMEFEPTLKTDTEMLLAEDRGGAVIGSDPADQAEPELVPLGEEDDAAAEFASAGQSMPDLLDLDEEPESPGEFGPSDQATADFFVLEEEPDSTEESAQTAPLEPEILVNENTDTLFTLREENMQAADFDSMLEPEPLSFDSNALPAAEAYEPHDLGFSGNQASASGISLDDWIIDLKEDELVELALEEALREQEAEETDWGHMFGIEPATDVASEESQLSLPASSEQIEGIGEEFEEMPEVVLSDDDTDFSTQEVLESESVEIKEPPVGEEPSEESRVIEFEEQADIVSQEPQETTGEETVSEQLLDMFLEEAEQEEQTEPVMAESDQAEESGQDEIVLEIETGDEFLEFDNSGVEAFLHDAEESEEERIGVPFTDEGIAEDDQEVVEGMAESDAKIAEESQETAGDNELVMELDTDEDLLEFLEQSLEFQSQSEQESPTEEEILGFTEEMPTEEESRTGEFRNLETVQFFEEEPSEAEAIFTPLTPETVPGAELTEEREALEDEEETESVEVINFVGEPSVVEEFSEAETAEEEEVVGFLEQSGVEVVSQDSFEEHEIIQDFEDSISMHEISGEEFFEEEEMDREEPSLLDEQPPSHAEISQDIHDLRRRIDDLEQQLERTEEEKYFLQERFAAQVSHHKAHEESLQREISDVYKDKEELEERLHQAVKGMYPAQNETAITKKTGTFNDNRYDALVSKIEGKKAQIQKHLQSVLKKREANGRFLSQELKTLSTTKQRLQSNLEYIQKVKSRIEERINTELHEARQHIQALTKTSQQLEEKLKEQQLSELTLRKQFNVVTREKDSLEGKYTTALEAVTHEKAELEKQVEKATKAKTVIEKTLKKKLKAVYNSYQKLKGEYTSALESKEIQITESAQQLSEFADKYVKLEKTLAEIRKERDELHSVLAEETATREMLEQKLVHIESEVDSLELQGSKLLTQLGQELDRHFKMEQSVSDKFQLSLEELEGLLVLQEQEIRSLEELEASNM